MNEDAAITITYDRREYRVWPDGRVALWVKKSTGKARYSRGVDALGPTAKAVRELARLQGHEVAEPTDAILGGLRII